MPPAADISVDAEDYVDDMQTFIGPGSSFTLILTSTGSLKGIHIVPGGTRRQHSRSARLSLVDARVEMGLSRDPKDYINQMDSRDRKQTIFSV